MSIFESDCVVEDTRVDTTRADGVVLERRTMLRISAATIAAAFALTGCRAGRPRVVAPDHPVPLPDGAIDVSECLAQMYPQSLECIASGGANEEAYLMSVSALLARLRIPSKPELNSAVADFIASQDKTRKTFEIRMLMFAFEPGKGFKHHDHRHYNGIILGVEGEVRCRNFDIVGEELVPPKGETFQIRQTRDDLILPGRFSTLARDRDNVHEVTAGPQGGKVLDVFTYFRPGARSYSMKVDDTPRDDERRIYDAVWT